MRRFHLYTAVGHISVNQKEEHEQERGLPPITENARRAGCGHERQKQTMT